MHFLNVIKLLYRQVWKKGRRSKKQYGFINNLIKIPTWEEFWKIMIYLDVLVIKKKNPVDNIHDRCKISEDVICIEHILALDKTT